MNAKVEPKSATTSTLIALIGNPNTGKTTLFNALTGARGRVGNYPGVTVERRSGTRSIGDREVEIVDLPGTYSLSARSADEMIAMRAVLGLGGQPRPDLAVVVVDAGQLVRNFYLVLQLIELAVPVVIALNMIDELDEPIDHDRLAKQFGVVVVPMSARSGTGVDALDAAIDEALASPGVPPEKAVAYPDAVAGDVARVVEALPKTWRDSERRDRALALWALCSVDADDELPDIDPNLRTTVRAVQDAAEGAERDLDHEIIAARYKLLDDEVSPQPEGAKRADPPVPRARQLTDRVDAVVLHPVYGFAVFIALMLVVFQSLFSWADPAIGVVETLFGWIGTQAKAHLPPGFFADLITEGIIAGVGNVVVFLPQILLLFLLMGLLEDSGYMARAAYLMDRIMKALGLHGRAFVPMLSGCACAIPAIMATRTMERERDRLLTMLVVPLMTCSARLPVYTLIIAALFPPSELFGFMPVQGLLMVFMYLFSTAVTLIAAGVIGRTVVKGRRMPLLLELPPYRMPTFRSVLRQTGERATVFLKEAGTVILVCTIVLWGLLSYPKLDPIAVAPPASETTAQSAQADSAQAAQPDAEAAAEAKHAADQLAHSYGGRLGKAIEPAIAPLGFDWKLGVGIIGAFAAREVFVSTMGVVYGIGGDADEESVPLRDKIRADTRADGTPVYTPLMGLSLMLFFALACQCMSTLAVVKRETRGWKWPAFLFAYMTALAWVVSFLTYQGGRLLGFS